MKKNPLNVSYLVVGLAFLGIAASWLLHETGVVGSADVEWLLPLTLVIAGGVGLIAFATRGMSGRRTTDPTTDAGYDQSYDLPHDSEGELR